MRISKGLTLLMKSSSFEVQSNLIKRTIKDKKFAKTLGRKPIQLTFDRIDEYIK